MRRAAFCVFAGLVALAAPMVVAQSAAPGQGAASMPPKSTALILGQIVDGSSGQPIPEAIVTLSGGRGATTGGALPAGAAASAQAQQAMQMAVATAAASAGRGVAGPAPQRVMTGADGRFVFHDLPPGQFQLSASLTGYTPSLNTSPPADLGAAMSNAMSVVAATPATAAPVAVTLTEGEFATGLKLRLWKNAVVSGTVLDDGGQPAIGLMVQVARRSMAAGRARYVPAASARTDDRGSYRISSLVPGDYLVVVPQTQVSIPTSLMTGLIESMTGGGAAGGGLALLEMMTSGVNPSEAMSGGVRIGDFMVASSGSVPLIGTDGRLQAYQTIFYPGAAAPAQASVVSLKSGEDRTDVDFHLRLIPTSRVSGTAMGPEGPVANLGIRLVVPSDGVGTESGYDVATAMTKADGTFAFHGVPPGQFLLRAQKSPLPAITAEMLSNPMAQMMFGSVGIAATNDMLYAATTVNVAGADVDGIALQLAAGFRAIGRIEFENPSGRPLPAANQIQTLTVTLTAMDGRSLGGMAGGLSAPDRANAQGEFRTRGYSPGKYFVSVSGAGMWLMKSATMDGRDVLDAPLEIKNADATGIIVTFTDQIGRVSGTVTATGETDLTETSVLLFPADYRAWTENGMNPRRVRTARASRAGAYSLANVPAGEYLVAAIDRASEGDMQDPVFIEALARVGTTVTVGTDARTLNLAKARVAR